MNRLRTAGMTLAMFGLVLTTNWVLADDSRQHIEEQLQAFLANADTRSAHETFWADDLIYTSSSGERFDKAFILSGFDQEGSAQTDSDSDDNADEAETKYSGEDIDIRLFDDVAIVAFKLVGVQNQNGARQEYFNTGTLMRRGGRWQVVAWQATKIPTVDSQ